MSNVENIVARPATRWARPGGTPARSNSSASTISGSTSDGPSSRWSAFWSAVAPGEKKLTVAPMSSGRRAVRQQPARAALDEPAALEQQPDLHLGGDLVVERLDLAPLGAHREDVARRGVGAGDLRCGRAALLVQPEGERRAAAVRHVVDHLRGDDLAAQPVAADLVAEALRQRRREVAVELARTGAGPRGRPSRAAPRTGRSCCTRARPPARAASARCPRGRARRAPRRSAAPRARGRGCVTARAPRGSACARRPCRPPAPPPARASRSARGCP